MEQKLNIQIALLTFLLSFNCFSASTPEERKKLFAEATSRLKDSKIEDKILKKGEVFPDLSINGKKVSEYLQAGPLVITFYRGGWCPYCIKQLKEINSSLKELTKKATLIAISPETKNQVLMTKKKNGLDFQLFSDTNNSLARQLNLTFKVEQKVVQEYEALGIDLKASQENENDELPIPASFVIGKNRIVRYAFADADYTKRASTKDLIEAVKAIQKE